MIIGQDWGPYNDMMKFHDAYVTEKNTSNWEKIMECENSLTKHDDIGQQQFFRSSFLFLLSLNDKKHKRVSLA